MTAHVYPAGGARRRVVLDTSDVDTWVRERGMTQDAGLHAPDARTGHRREPERPVYDHPRQKSRQVQRAEVRAERKAAR